MRKKYNPKGIETLINVKKGTKNYQDGYWLGYYEDFKVIIDLRETTAFNTITVGFLQDTRAWIDDLKDLLLLGLNNACIFEEIN